jgi:DNA (cytosine-5)-methyltransferase 1
MAAVKRPKALGCHIYSGAFSLGIQRAGFKIAGQWEEGPWGAATFDLNFPKVPHPLTLEDWPVSQLEHVNLIYANPPCAPWSTAGGRLGMADPRLGFTRNVFDLALQLRPEALIVESVPRAWSLNGGQAFYKTFAEAFQRVGYAVTIYLTNGLLVGGPQWRERFHFIAHRGELEIPEPTITVDDLPLVWDMINDLAITARWLGEEPLVPNHVVRRPDEIALNVLRNMLPGEGVMGGVDRARAQGLPFRKARGLSTGRLRGNAPCSTLFDLTTTVHPYVDRPLTLREGARLSGYPDDFVFALTTRPDAHDGCSTDVSQAVLPPMGYHLGQLVLRSLDSARAEPGSFRVINRLGIARPWSPGRYVKRGIVD